MDALTEAIIKGLFGSVPNSVRQVNESLAHEILERIRTAAAYRRNLGVDDEYRRSGVATQLVLKRLNDMPPGSIAVMRTSVRNEASRKLYEQLGFRMVEGAFQNVMQRRVDGSEVEDTRLFLAKQLP